jgi:uncharacterized protein
MMMQKHTRMIVRALALLAVTVAPVAAETLPDSTSHAYATPIATRIIQRASHGDPRAQAEVGLMYATGREVPQSFASAVEWYRRAAEQGEPAGQYFLGLMYDKGQGVQQDAVVAHKWLILAAAKAKGRTGEYYASIRDAIAFKLTSEQIARAQHLAAEWTPVREK